MRYKIVLHSSGEGYGVSCPATCRVAGHKGPPNRKRWKTSGTPFGSIWLSSMRCFGIPAMPVSDLGEERRIAAGNRRHTEDTGSH